MAILAILFTVGLTNWKRQIGVGLDARKKGDLQNLKVALEQYYNDYDCYPPQALLSSCGGSGLVPYMQSIPCDPDFNTAYRYEPQDPTSICRGYRLFTKLHDTSDPAIVRAGCDPVTGCNGDAKYNYGVSEGGGVGQ